MRARSVALTMVMMATAGCGPEVAEDAVHTEEVTLQTESGLVDARRRVKALLAADPQKLERVAQMSGLPREGGRVEGQDWVETRRLRLSVLYALSIPMPNVVVTLEAEYEEERCRMWRPDCPPPSTFVAYGYVEVNDDAEPIRMCTDSTCGQW